MSSLSHDYVTRIMDPSLGSPLTLTVTIWKLGRTVCMYSMVQRREKEKDSRHTGGIWPLQQHRVSDL
jgi:hypothetical protein